MFRIICFFAIVLFAPSAGAAPHLLMDLDNGKVISQREAFDPWHPASLTKLMTALVAFKAIEEGKVERTMPVVVSRNATRQPPSKMGYSAGSRVTLEDALKLLIVKSANDISVAIAEALGGSVEGFADQMNREARRLGMTGSRFVNPHGLHDARQVVTARDLGLLLQELHRSHPQYATWFAEPAVLADKRTKKKKLINRVYYSYNLLLERYRGADGFKTGFVCASGYNFAAGATRSGRRLAAIVLGRDSQTSRAVDAAKLLTSGFEQPVGTGIEIAELMPSTPPPASPRNMRAVMCSEAARAKRYEPGAGVAVIKSPWLTERVRQKVALSAKLLTGKAGARRPVTVPTPRPEYAPPAPIDGVVAASLGRVALPTFRPVTR